MYRDWNRYGTRGRKDRTERLAPESKGAIELRQITKSYGKERVVDAVSATIAPGEFFSLLGPSGSGKTTTLMMIAGFAEIDEGRILVDGADIGASRRSAAGSGWCSRTTRSFRTSTSSTTSRFRYARASCRPT